MNRFVPLYILLGLLAFNLHKPTPTPVPTPTPSVPVVIGPELSAVFAANPDKTQVKDHADKAANLMQGIGDALEYDGQQAKPRIINGGQIEDLRILARQYATKGWSFDMLYPTFGAAVGSYLDSKAGTDSGQLSADARKAWVDAFHALSAACSRVAKGA